MRRQLSKRPSLRLTGGDRSIFQVIIDWSDSESDRFVIINKMRSAASVIEAAKLSSHAAK